MLARGRLGHMHSASGAGIEAVNGAQRVDRLLDVADRHADERLLERAVLALLVVRSEIPRGRNDNLIALDAAVFNLLSMVECAARCLPETLALAGDAGGLAEVLAVAALHGLDELIHPFLHEACDVERLDLADAGTTERGAERIQVARRAERLEHRVDVLHDEGHVALVCNEDTGKRARLHRLALITRALDPGVAVVDCIRAVLVVLGVFRFGGVIRSLTGFLALVPGMAHVLGNLRGIDVLELEAVLQDACRHVALVQEHALVLEHTPSDIATAALAPVESIRVVRREGEHVGKHGRFDPVVQLVDEVLQVIELARSGNERGAARNDGHDVGHLAAEQSRDLGSLRLHLESLKIVRGKDEVEFRGKLVARAVLGIEPVAREDGQLTVVGELGETLLQGVHIARGSASLGSRQVVRVADVRLQGVQRVHVVKAGQVVEPQDVAVQELGALDQVADDARVIGDLDAVSLLSGDRGGVSMGNRANTADALHDVSSKRKDKK